MEYQSTGEQNSSNSKSSNFYSFNSLSNCGIGGELQEAEFKLSGYILIRGTKFSLAQPAKPAVFSRSPPLLTFCHFLSLTPGDMFLMMKTLIRDGCFRRLKFIARNSSLTHGRIIAGGGGEGCPLPPLRCFFFLNFCPRRQNISTWCFQQLLVYPSRAF